MNWVWSLRVERSFGLVSRIVVPIASVIPDPAMVLVVTGDMPHFVIHMLIPTSRVRADHQQPRYVARSSLVVHPADDSTAENDGCINSVLLV